MTPKLVTFDCAQTLLDVTYRVDTFARSCCEEIGIDLPSAAFDRYRQLYFSRLPSYLAVNQTRDPAQGDAWWRELSRDWLAQEGLDLDHAVALTETSHRIGFRPGSIIFRLYEDVVPCLDRLRAAGVRVAVISNWDYSLHRALAIFDLNRRFECVLASLEEGVEKPDPRLFHICLSKLGVAPADALHVGDSLTDDVEGARNAGLRAVRIVRDGAPSEGEIATLDHLEAAFAWSR